MRQQTFSLEKEILKQRGAGFVRIWGCVSCVLMVTSEETEGACSQKKAFAPLLLLLTELVIVRSAIAGNFHLS